MQNTGTKLPTTPKRPSSPPTRWVFSTSTSLRPTAVLAWVRSKKFLSTKNLHGATQVSQPPPTQRPLRARPSSRGPPKTRKNAGCETSPKRVPLHRMRSPNRERARTSPPAKPPPSKTVMITSSTVQKCGSPAQVMRISSLSLRRPTPMQVIEVCRVSSWKKTRQAFPSGRKKPTWVNVAPTRAPSLLTMFACPLTI